MKPGIEQGERPETVQVPFLPLIEETLGYEEVPYEMLPEAYRETVTLARNVCTGTDFRDTGTEIPEEVKTSSEVPYAVRYGTAYTLRLVLSHRRITSADLSGLPAVELEVIAHDAGQDVHIRPVAALSCSALSVYAGQPFRVRGEQAADLDGFMRAIRFIGESLAGQTSV